MTVHYPEQFANTEGTFYPKGGGEVADGIRAMTFFYVAMPKDKYNDLMTKEDPTEEELNDLRSRTAEMLYVLSINKGREAADIVNAFSQHDLKEEDFTEVAKVEDVTYYLFDVSKLFDMTSGFEPEFVEEFDALHDALIDVVKNAEYFPAIIPGAKLVGQTLKFETTDMDGNPVKSEDIFAQNKITMINIWATWCGNCIDELHELSEMNKRYADKGVAVIGICNDADTKPDECKALIAENEVEYLNLMPIDDLDEMLEIPGLPTSYFVDSEGKILSIPFIGKPREISAYEKVIDSLLEGQEEVAVEQRSMPAPNDQGAYRVIVTNTDGDFVKDVKILFCSDTMCMVGKTDENGVATFNAEEGVIYTAHVMKFPEGYEPNADEYKTEGTYCDISIVLQKKQ